MVGLDIEVRTPDGDTVAMFRVGDHALTRQQAEWLADHLCVVARGFKKKDHDLAKIGDAIASVGVLTVDGQPYTSEERIARLERFREGNMT